MALMGALKMGLAATFGHSLLRALGVFPKGVIGVLLAVSGIELAVPARDMTGRRDTVVMLLGAGIVTTKLGIGAAFLISLAAAMVFKARGAFADERDCH